MEDYNKIIEALGIEYLGAKNYTIKQPVCVNSYKDIGNSLVVVHKGTFCYKGKKVAEGSCLFIPGNTMPDLCFGPADSKQISNDEFYSNQEKYIAVNSQPNSTAKGPENVSILIFEAKVFDAISFFASLYITPFVISDNGEINKLIINMISEVNSDRPGRDRIIKSLTEQIVVNINRYMLENRLFVEQLATNTTYFKDPRLIDVFKYIRNNVSGDLSNKVLASVANVSEDYVGQYFKMLTGINPQDYIEYQRMELAVNLLRKTKKSIREVGRNVGYKDTAYFCRRFKMMFGISAGKMRRREKVNG